MRDLSQLQAVRMDLDGKTYRIRTDFEGIAYQAFNRKIMGNMVMLGFLVAISGVVSERSMKDSIASNVPKGTEEMNVKAYEKGLEMGREAKGK